MNEGRLPTALWVEAVLKPLNDQGVFYYITNKGNHDSGVLLLKITDTQGQCRLVTQERDWDGDLQWIDVLGEDNLEEARADAYITKAIQRDPDLWAIEIEDTQMRNPFDI